MRGAHSGWHMRKAQPDPSSLSTYMLCKEEEKKLRDVELWAQLAYKKYQLARHNEL